jgi:hypothetical protein
MISTDTHYAPSPPDDPPCLECPKGHGQIDERQAQWDKWKTLRLCPVDGCGAELVRS